MTDTHTCRHTDTRRLHYRASIASRDKKHTTVNVEVIADTRQTGSDVKHQFGRCWSWRCLFAGLSAVLSCWNALLPLALSVLTCFIQSVRRIRYEIVSLIANQGVKLTPDVFVGVTSQGTVRRPAVTKPFYQWCWVIVILNTGCHCQCQYQLSLYSAHTK